MFSKLILKAPLCTIIHTHTVQICMVGDRLDTDIMFGKNGGLSTCLVLSGVLEKESMGSESPQ